MPLADIQFSLNSQGIYESEAMKGIEGSLDIHLEFDRATRIRIRRSITGDNYTQDRTISDGAYVYDDTISDMSSNLYVKLYCDRKPLVAKKSA